MGIEVGDSVEAFRGRVPTRPGFGGGGDLGNPGWILETRDAPGCRTARAARSPLTLASRVSATGPMTSAPRAQAEWTRFELTSEV